MIGIAGTPPGRHVKTPDDQDLESKNREFVRLLAENERRLSAYVHTLIPLWQDAEDVLQNTKLRLWEQFDSFQGGTDFAAWTFTIAGYMVRAHRKTCQRQRICFSDDLLEKITRHMSTPSSSSVREKRHLALVECVYALSSARRKLLRLFCTSHQRIKDLARDLGQSPDAIRMALFRIRRTLLACVQERLQEERLQEEQAR
jgi:RNA polymerase sigma-70 factor, ECF subfamily